MASQVAHIIYARKYFKAIEEGRPLVNSSNGERYENPSGKIDRDEFILGSVFPDIRRIDEDIKRKDTHLFFPKIDLNFSGLSSFEAGWKFHLFCDMRREDILNRYGFYTLKGTGDFEGLSAKILEDEVVYDGYDNWEKTCAYFNDPPAIDLKIRSVSHDTFCLWYAILSKYMAEKPSNQTMRIFLAKQPRLVAKANDMVNSISGLRKNRKVLEILSKVKEEIV